MDGYAGGMIVEKTLAPVFGVNCYVLAAGPGQPAVVVDPGAGSVRGALALLRSNKLTLGAVLLTHGHADHVWDVQRLIEAADAEGLLANGEAAETQDADRTQPLGVGQDGEAGEAASDAGTQGGSASGIPVYIPEPDRYRLNDPDTTTAIRSNGMTFADMADSPWLAPRDIRIVPASAYSQAWEIVPGVGLQAVAVPGHSEGSTLFFFNARLGDNALLFEAEVLDDPSDIVEQDYLLALSADVLFKGSVGRTDLPGGDQIQMWATLRFLGSAISPDTVLLPGHGAVTTMAHENAGNPYLAEAKLRGGDMKE